MGVPDYNRPIGSSSACRYPRGVSLPQTSPTSGTPPNPSAHAQPPKPCPRPRRAPLPHRISSPHSVSPPHLAILPSATQQPTATATDAAYQALVASLPDPGAGLNRLEWHSSLPGSQGCEVPRNRLHDVKHRHASGRASPRAPAPARAAVAIRNEGRVRARRPTASTYLLSQSSTSRRPTLRHPAADSGPTNAAYQALVASLPDSGAGRRRLEWHSSLPGSQGCEVPRNRLDDVHMPATQTRIWARRSTTQAHAHRPQRARPSPYAMRAEYASPAPLHPLTSSPSQSSTPRRPTLRHPAADSAATDAAYQSLVASLPDPGVGPNRLEWHSSLPGSQGCKVPRNPSGRRAHARNTDTHLGAQAYAHRPQHARPSPYAMRADAAADTTLPPSPSSAPHSRRRAYSSAAQKRTEQLRIPPIAPSLPCNRPGPRPRANYLSVAWPCSSAWQPLPVLLCKASPHAAVAIRNEGRVRAPHPTAIHPPVSPPHLAALLFATQQLRTPPLAVAISQQPPPTHRSHRSYSNTPPFPPQSSAPPRRPTQRSPRTSTSPAARRHPAVQGAAADAAYRTLRHAMFPTLALLLRVAARVPVVSNTNTRPGRQDDQALPYAASLGSLSCDERLDAMGGVGGETSAGPVLRTSAPSPSPVKLRTPAAYRALVAVQSLPRHARNTNSTEGPWKDKGTHSIRIRTGPDLRQVQAQMQPAQPSVRSGRAMPRVGPGRPR
ncbi:hypothetical protein JB92DRAFT_3114337 [Gautieria morchelliformis]|nr:hypothetical protein JB92DRAFT_3114337 [Gautieria morchelliformis]